MKPVRVRQVLPLLFLPLLAPAARATVAKETRLWVSIDWNRAPAGTATDLATAITSEPSNSISRLSNPTAWVGASPRNEFEHTSSARSGEACAGEKAAGLDSHSSTSQPACASCQAASHPASPPPITVHDGIGANHSAGGHATPGRRRDRQATGRG